MERYNNTVGDIKQLIKDARPDLAEAKRILELAKKAGKVTAPHEQKIREIESEIMRWEKAIAEQGG